MHTTIALGRTIAKGGFAILRYWSYTPLRTATNRMFNLGIDQLSVGGLMQFVNDGRRRWEG